MLAAYLPEVPGRATFQFMKTISIGFGVALAALLGTAPGLTPNAAPGGTPHPPGAEAHFFSLPEMEPRVNVMQAAISVAIPLGGA